MELKLNEFKPGMKGIVISITGDKKIRRRLLDMGVTPQTNIVMVKAAPLGDPIEVNLRGYELTLRKSEAMNIVMEVENA